MMAKKRRKKFKEPTIKQKIAFKKLAENGGTLGKALKEAGYSEEVQTNPKKVTESLGWKSLMEQYLPDKLLVERHNQLLNKKETMVVKDRFGGVELVPTGEIDAQAVKAGLDLAYRIKGKSRDEEAKTVVNINIGRSEEIQKALQNIAEL